MQWSQRAATEISWGQRTWFGTLTLRPDAYYAMECRARSAGATFWVHSQISAEITRYLKRVRKESGARFRYVVVAEKHKSGKLHYHFLLTEVPGSSPVRHKTLKDQWRLGFSKMKLVDDARYAARYVSKYLSKSALARVRASRTYGRPPALEAAVAVLEKRQEITPIDLRHSCGRSIENGTPVEMDRGSDVLSPDIYVPQRENSTTPPQDLAFAASPDRSILGGVVTHKDDGYG